MQIADDNVAVPVLNLIGFPLVSHVVTGLAAVAG
jgi:hypothetical protein